MSIVASSVLSKSKPKSKPRPEELTHNSVNRISVAVTTTVSAPMTTATLSQRLTEYEWE